MILISSYNSYHLSSGQWVADYIIRYLMVLNSSVNFIIYCFYGSKFRQVLKNNFAKIFRVFRVDEGVSVEDI